MTCTHAKKVDFTDTELTFELKQQGSNAQIWYIKGLGVGGWGGSVGPVGKGKIFCFFCSRFYTIILLTATTPLQQTMIINHLINITSGYSIFAK